MKCRMSLKSWLGIIFVINAAAAMIVALVNIIRASNIEGLITDEKVKSIVESGYYVNLITIFVIPIFFSITYYIFQKVYVSMLDEMRYKLEEMTKGNLDIKVNQSCIKGEIGKMYSAIDILIEKFRGILRSFAESTVSLKSASVELSSLQHKSISEINLVHDNASSVSSAGEELTATSANIVESCQISINEIENLSMNINNGKDIADSTKVQMEKIADGINSLSKNIKEFINKYSEIEKFTVTINDIADQTNMLALNAAIEAARAGESGRGFAVVADEVRKLSMKTTDSTKEIKSVIVNLNGEMKQITKIMTENVNEIKGGIELSLSTYNVFDSINGQISGINNQINSILRSMEEENLAVQDISKSVSEISYKMDNVSDIVQESNRTGDTLGKLASELTENIKFFNIGKIEELITWTRSFETGVKKFDEQHKILVKLINKFYSAMQSGSSKSFMANILKELAEYTVYHFSSEEDVFKKYNFPDKEEHMRKHKMLVDQVSTLISDLNNGKDVLSINLLNFLKDWLTQHILKDDMKYGKYFKESKIDLK